MSDLVGRHPDQLSLTERHQIAGKWLAFELYSPVTLPLKRIEAVGATAEECVERIRSRGLRPANYEYVLMKTPY